MARPLHGYVAVIVSVALVGAALVAAPASAAGDKKRFCTLAFAVGADVTDPGSTELQAENAALLEASYRKLIKPAPTKKLNKAVRTIAKVYGKVADGETVISPGLTADFQTANGTFATYLATRCATDLVITEFTLPDGSPVTLPGGGPVTLPEGLDDLPDLPGG